MKALNSTNKEILAADLHIAASYMTRLVGLMGREKMKDGEGLLIKGSSNSIHTFFMKFPIDLLFIDKKGLVRFAKENVAPWRMVFAPLLTGTDCLELPAGVIKKTATKVGDVIRVEA